MAHRAARTPTSRVGSGILRDDNPLQSVSGLVSIAFNCVLSGLTAFFIGNFSENFSGDFGFFEKKFGPASPKDGRNA